MNIVTLKSVGWIKKLNGPNMAIYSSQTIIFSSFLLFSWSEVNRMPDRPGYFKKHLVSQLFYSLF